MDQKMKILKLHLIPALTSSLRGLPIMALALQDPMARRVLRLARAKWFEPLLHQYVHEFDCSSFPTDQVTSRQMIKCISW